VGGRTEVHEERSGQPSVVSDGLVQSVDQKTGERRCFTISELLCGFPQISHTVLCEIITVRVGSHKFGTKWFPKMLTSVHKMQGMASSLTFLEQYHKSGNEFLNHII
jgi:hypothetical protein